MTGKGYLEMPTAMPLGQTGLTVPRMGLGAMVWGQPIGRALWAPTQLINGTSDSPEEEKRALDVSVAAGVNLIDTAEIYTLGASEKRVGELTRGRPDVLVATKFPPSSRTGLGDFKDALAASLQRLDRDSIDLFQHHFPFERTPIPKIMNLMADAVEAGQIRAIGVSNYSPKQMRLAHETLAKRGIALASNQVEYSLLHRQPEVDGVLETCRELGVTLIAYAPLAGGILTGKYGVGKPKPRELRRLVDNRFHLPQMLAQEPLLMVLRTLAKQHSASPSQIALAWLLGIDGVLPVPTAKNSEQAASNAAALDVKLTTDDVATLNAASERWEE